MFEPQRIAIMDHDRTMGGGKDCHVDPKNVGMAVLLAAIADYGRTDALHQSASEFLYPQTEVHRERFEWALAIAGDLNPVWVREMLDKKRPDWDRARYAKARTQ